MLALAAQPTTATTTGRDGASSTTTTKGAGGVPSPPPLPRAPTAAATPGLSQTAADTCCQVLGRSSNVVEASPSGSTTATSNGNENEGDTVEDIFAGLNEA